MPDDGSARAEPAPGRARQEDPTREEIDAPDDRRTRCGAPRAGWWSGRLRRPLPGPCAARQRGGRSECQWPHAGRGRVRHPPAGPAGRGDDRGRGRIAQGHVVRARVHGRCRRDGGQDLRAQCPVDQLRQRPAVRARSTSGGRRRRQGCRQDDRRPGRHGRDQSCRRPCRPHRGLRQVHRHTRCGGHDRGPRQLPGRRAEGRPHAVVGHRHHQVRHRRGRDHHRRGGGRGDQGQCPRGHASHGRRG